MTQAMVYERPALLDREKHRAVRVRPVAGYGFARRANSVVLAASEFAEACKEYAVVFTRASDGRVMPAVVLGLRGGENLFVGDDGGWDARTIPAYVRRYPFVLAELPGEPSLAVCIDEACPGLGQEEGEPLFDAEGRETAYLRTALDFLAAYQREIARTQAFCARLAQAGVLVDMNARADLVDGRSFTLNGLLVVDEKKLLALPDATALALFRAGELHLVSLHLASLSNLQRLVDRVAQRPSPIAPAPRPGA